MKRIFLYIAITASIMSLSAQTANDAITFGQQYHGGTARYMAMGGAFNALGGDFSTLSVNPAGIGIYRSNEFTFTMDLRFSESTTIVDDKITQIKDIPLSPYNTSFTETKSNFNLNSVGYVSGSDLGNSGLVRINFGFGYNRLKNYHKAYRAEVWESPHSLTDNWARSLNEDELSTLGAYLADRTYVLNRLENNAGQILKYESPLFNNNRVDYVKDVVEEGRINEWVFSTGGNVGHWLYFGATFGLQDINIRKEYFQTEYLYIDGLANSYQRYYFDDNDNQQPDVIDAINSDRYTYYSQEYTNGIGLNGKFGIIVRPLDIFRFGVAIHSPTVNFLTVESYGDMTNFTAYYDEKNNFIDPSEGGTPGEDSYTEDDYDYRTITPYKVNASAAVILGKFLAIDAEVDMVDYSTMKIKDTNGGTYVYTDANNAIKEMYKTAYNARIGAELKFAQVFALRAGASYYGSPYENNITYDGSGNMFDAADYIGDRFDYSGGFGIRAGDFFLDMAYIRSIQDNRTMVYDGALSPNEFYEMGLNHTTNRYMMTLGFKF